MDFLIKLDNLKVVKNGKTLIEKIDWTMKPGESWAILGRNGAGKSTLLQVILGYIKPYYGSKIHYFGDMSLFFNIWDIRTKIGYISYELEDMYRYNEQGIDVVLTGFYSSIGLYEEPDNDMIQNAKGWFSRFGILNLMDKKIKNMSQGERQKVFLLRALIHKPRILVLDEPFVGLDIPSKEEILLMVDEIGRSGTSLILTTHLPDEIVPSVTHVLYLKNGKPFKMGKKEEMLRDEIFSEAFDCDIKLFKDGERYRVGKVNLHNL